MEAVSAEGIIARAAERMGGPDWTVAEIAVMFLALRSHGFDVSPTAVCTSAGQKAIELVDAFWQEARLKRIE